jgi:hypothetical protein
VATRKVAVPARFSWPPLSPTLPARKVMVYVPGTRFAVKGNR